NANYYHFVWAVWQASEANFCNKTSLLEGFQPVGKRRGGAFAAGRGAIHAGPAHQNDAAQRPRETAVGRSQAACESWASVRRDGMCTRSTGASISSSLAVSCLRCAPSLVEQKRGCGAASRSGERSPC